MKLQFCEIRKKRINDFVLAIRGIDFDLFYQGGMINRFPQDLSMLIDSQIQRYELGTTILIAGVDDLGAHIFAIGDPGSMSCFDRVGYHAIGVGHRHALLKLVALGQYQSKSISETIFNVFCAKRSAELAPGVGQATSMKIVTRTKTRAIPQNVLEELASVYNEHANSVNDSIRETIAKLSIDHGDDDDGPIEKA